MADLEVVIQGYGNVGSWMARELIERGAQVTAVSDVAGGIHRGDGLDLDELDGIVRDGGVVGDGTGDQISNDELLAMECDVLAPAALGQAITGDNADQVQAGVVLEAANYPVIPAADEILGERGVVVIPDILANAGGVTGSYFEWTMNIQQFTWPEEQFNARLDERLRTAYAATQAKADEEGITLRTAAFALGIARVAEASLLRGYI